MKKFSVLLTFLSAISLTACNGHNEEDNQNNIDDSPSTITDENARLGYFDDNNSFIEGKIKLSVGDNTVSAGGTVGLSVTVVDSSDAIITTPVTVTFSSNCATNNTATIDAAVLSINGVASSTFEDISCAGAFGNEDVFSASITINDLTINASESITITGESLGSIEFVSAEPTNIVLKGTGGLNQQESSTITFRIKSALGNVLAQQPVEFSLDSSAGGVRLSKTQGLTNNEGLISTQVLSGTVPTSVRVTAKVDGSSVQSQSDLLSINTGLPHQASMSIGASEFNIEALNYNDETSTITARLADNFNNPVADGTTVNFTSEGGSIEPTCNTIAGACSVTWTSGNPRPADHRITILATAIGHETFVDTNGNNVFDDADGEAITDFTDTKYTISSGFGNIPVASSGFLDMSEAWRDDNANGTYDVGEKFFNFNNKDGFNPANGEFNGPQCEGSLCSDVQSIHIRKALEIVMSGSTAYFALTNGDKSVTFQDNDGEVTAITDIADLADQDFILSFTDSAGQKLPAGTTVEVDISKGTVIGATTYSVKNSASVDTDSMSFKLSNTADDEASMVTLSITFTTPKGVITTNQPLIFNLL